MNFRDYCSNIESTDGASSQRIEINDTGEIIRFIQNKSNKEFLIASKDIFAYLKYVGSYNDEIEKAIRSDERFNKELFTQYEEKGYRALYSSLSGIAELSLISSLGGSQSLGVTQVVSKVIGFLSEQTYKGVKDNTFLDKAIVEKAITNLNSTIQKSLQSEIQNSSTDSLKVAFITWLESHPKSWSKSTIKKYSQDSINKANEILSTTYDNSNAIYSVNDSKDIAQYIEVLNTNDEWISRNKTGNSMFARGLDLYKEFLEATFDKDCKIKVGLILPKPFLLLAGISGTGKTRFVREQAKDSGSLKETYSLVSVRPDWHEPSDLLGYVSRLKDKAEYVSTDVVEFIARAWRAIIDSDLVMSEQIDEKTGDIKLVVQGDSNALGAISPYWLCLDEMNLAPVEQYFADYLSVIETRKWEWQGSDFTYGCDALLSASTINNSDYSVQLRKQLGFEDTKYDNSWQLFKKHGISIPFNLIVAGTVNMDETTHGFSRKVIDRALSFDFGEFFPNEIDDFFESSKVAKSLSYPIYSQAKREQFESIQADNDAQKTTTFFKSINEVLKGTAFELAFRAFNELCLSVISFAPENDDQLAAVFDDFLMCKVLPRIEGDEDKLTTAQGEPLLPKLNEVIATELTLIWEGQRLDYFRQLKDSDDKAIKVNCRSKVKLERMQSQLDTGFTSFWP